MPTYIVSVESTGYATNATFDDLAAAQRAFEQAPRVGVLRITLAKIDMGEQVEVLSAWER